MKIGFVGIGNMGKGMAANLLKAGHEVLVFNRSVAKCAPLVEQGARAVGTLAEFASVDCVVSMVADDVALRALALGPEGFVASLPAAATHISMSTIGVPLSDELESVHRAAGQRYVAAPVFGRPEAAAAGKLFIIAAGDGPVIDACEPVFSAIGQKTFVVGTKPSAANVVKLAGNFMLASALEAMGEAVTLVDRAGVDRQAFIDLLTSTIFPAPPYKTYGGLIATKKYSPPGMPASLGYKDIRLALAAAEELRVPMPLGNLLRDRLLRVVVQGGEKFDWAALGMLCDQDAGNTA